MARLRYVAIASLDGYVADAAGRFDWAAPDEEVHQAVNDLMRPFGTYLYGRRMYEVMRFWATPEASMETEPEVMRDFAGIWRGAEKVVYSASLPEVETSRTRLERAFDPAAVGAALARADRDWAIGGPTLAAAAFEAGLVAEVDLFLVPVAVGAGLPALPAMRLDLASRDVRRFANGTVHLGYRVRR